MVDPKAQAMGGGVIDRYRIGGHGDESHEQVALGVGDRRDMAARGLVTQKMTGRWSQLLVLDPLSLAWLSPDRALLLT